MMLIFKGGQKYKKVYNWNSDVDWHLLWDSISRFKTIYVSLFSHCNRSSCDGAWSLQEKKTFPKSRSNCILRFFVLWQHIWPSKEHKLLLHELRNKTWSDFVPKLWIKTKESRVLIKKSHIWWAEPSKVLGKTISISIIALSTLRNHFWYASIDFSASTSNNG